MLTMCSLSSFAQRQDELISTIKLKVEKIDAQGDLQERTLDQHTFMKEISDGGGELTGYFVKLDLVKMKMEQILSSGFLEVTYYFQDSELIYAYQVERKLIGEYEDEDWIGWDFTAEPDTIFEASYYFDHQRLIDETNRGEQYFSYPFEIQEFLENTDQVRKTLIDN